MGFPNRILYFTGKGSMPTGPSQGKKGVSGKDREKYLQETRTVQVTVPLASCVDTVREVLARHTAAPLFS